MDKSFRLLQLRQADALVKPWLKKRMPQRPNRGWIQTIRESLGMTAVALARRLGVRSSSVHKFEQAEIDETISLASLRKVAAALDCELHYALVPRKPLEAMLHDKARELAWKQLMPIMHTMALEDQSVTNSAQRKQLEMLAQELLDGSWRDLWQEKHGRD